MTRVKLYIVGTNFNFVCKIKCQDQWIQFIYKQGLVSLASETRVLNSQFYSNIFWKFREQYVFNMRCGVICRVKNVKFCETLPSIVNEMTSKWVFSNIKILSIESNSMISIRHLFDVSVMSKFCQTNR